MAVTEDPRTNTSLPNPNLPEFWLRTPAEVDADIAVLHDAPLSFLPEEPIPDELVELFPEGPGAWVVTKHADILEISKNPDIYSSAKGITVRDTGSPEAEEFFSSMIVMDDPRHARMRKLVSAGFTPRMLKKLDETVQQQAAEIIDDICERGTVDFVVDVAAALPLKIVCDLMGIPADRYMEVFDNTNMILGASDPEYVSDPMQIMTSLLTAGGALAQLMNEVAESKKGADSDDLTTILVNSDIDGERLTESELASFFILLTVAGNETTRNAISWGLKYLTDNPDQRAIWEADFEGVAPTAVEEIVRLASPVTHMRRTATRDTMLGDTPIKEGDKLAMYYLAANRDPEIYEDPLAFRVERPSQQIGFGGPGPHFCLGAHLARREITVMFRELFRRLPDIHASGEPEVLRSNFIHGVKHLDATFTPQPKPGN